jgi:hypothetical protein
MNIDRKLDLKRRVGLVLVAGLLMLNTNANAQIITVCEHKAETPLWRATYPFRKSKSIYVNHPKPPCSWHVHKHFTTTSAEGLGYRRDCSYIYTVNGVN